MKPVKRERANEGRGTSAQGSDQVQGSDQGVGDEGILCPGLWTNSYVASLREGTVEIGYLCPDIQLMLQQMGAMERELRDMYNAKLFDLE